MRRYIYILFISLIFSNVSIASNIESESIKKNITKAKGFMTSEMYHSAISVLEPMEEMLFKDVDKIDDSTTVLLMEIQYLTSFSNFHLGNHEEAIKSLYKIIKNPRATPLDKLKAQVGLGNIFTTRNRIKSAEDAFKIALKIYQDNKLPDILAIDIYNNLSNVEAMKHNHDSSRYYLKKAEEFCVDDKYIHKKQMLIHNFGNNYRAMGNMTLAETCYEQAADMAKKMNSKYNFALAMNSLAELYLTNKQYDKALKCLMEAKATNDKIDAKQLGNHTLEMLSMYYEYIGDYKKALYYARCNKKLSDTIFGKETEEKILNMESDFKFYQVNIKDKMLEKDLAISKDKVYKRNVNIIVITIIAIFILVYAVYLIRKLIIQRKINKDLETKMDSFSLQERDSFLNEFQSELELKDKELTTSALLLVKVESIAEEVLEKLNILKVRLSIKGKNDNILQDIENSIQELFVGKGWDEFKNCFERINSSFYKNLDLKYPDLTPGDRRFAALLSLNLTTKEIAMLTNRTPRGVETSKSRLKKKMKLHSEDNITKILIMMK